jgi:hypothetical protein
MVFPSLREAVADKLSASVAHDVRRLQPFCSSGRTAVTVTVPPVTGVLIRARKVPNTLPAL